MAKVEKQTKEQNKENVMKKIFLEKVTLNCGVGVEPHRIEKSVKLLEMIGAGKAKIIITKKRIPAFGVRPGLKLGCKITLRKKPAEQLLKRLLDSIGNKLSPKQINPGSFAFGIKEYIEIPGVAYQRDIGLLGLDVCVTLSRPGARVEEKKGRRGKIPRRNRITKDETIKFMQDNFSTKFEEEK